MSEENKNPNEDETKRSDVDDEQEPLDSIEKTVEDLKRKIQELTEEDGGEKTAEPEKEKNAADPVSTAAGKIADGFNDLKDKAVNAARSEEMQKSITYIKENAVKAVKAVKESYTKFVNDPNVQAAGNKAVESINAFADKAKEKGQQLYDQLDDKTKDGLKETYDKVSGGVKDGVKAVDEYMSRPEVQEKITEVKTTAVDLAQKGADKVKELIDSSKK